MYSIDILIVIWWMLIIVSAIKVNIVRNAEVSLLVLYYPEGIGTYFISTILCNFFQNIKGYSFSR